MAGIFDLHTLLALQSNFPAYLENADSFKNTFGIERSIPDELLTAWHTQLVASPPVFRAHAAVGADQFPLVVIRLSDERHQDEGIGGAAHMAMVPGGDITKDGLMVSQFTVEQTLELTLMSKHPEITRALHVLVRATMHRSRQEFFKAGYLDIAYQSADELAADEELIAEELGVHVRKQRWTALSVVTVEETVQDFAVLPTKPWYVFVDDIVTEANPNAGQPGESDRVPDDPDNNVPGSSGGVIPLDP